MRINERHLCAFAAGSAPVDKQGYLMKRGETNRSFQKRWFVLKGNLLFYSEREGEREPIGVVVLEDCSVEVSTTEDAYAFELSFGAAGARTYVLAASTQEEMESWMQALTYASYDYMRRMVADLQGQLDVLNAHPAPEPRVPAPRPTRPAPPRPVPAPPALVPSLLDGFESFPEFNSALAGGVQLGEKGAGTRGGATGGRPRSFEEMHRDFGQRIEEIVGYGGSGGAAESLFGP